MKKSLTLRLKVLFIFSALVSAISLNAGTEGCTNDAITQEIFLTVPNNGSITETSTISIKAQFDIPFTVRSLEVVEEPKPSNKKPVSRSIILKDGKVDVDIIIRGSDMLPFLSPFNVAPQVRVKFGVISYITVDNISGVFESNETNPNGNIASRIISIEIIDEDLPVNESSILAQMLALETVASANQTAISNDRTSSYTNLTLFPNPVRDNLLNLKLANDDFVCSEILIFNSIGSLVYQEKVNGCFSGNYQINLPTMPSGVYFVKLLSNSAELVKRFNIIQ